MRHYEYEYAWSWNRQSDNTMSQKKLAMRASPEQREI